MAKSMLMIVFHLRWAEVARVTKTKAGDCQTLSSHREIYFRVQKTLPICSFTAAKFTTYNSSRPIIFVSIISDLETLQCSLGITVKLRDALKKSVLVYWVTQRVSFHHDIHWCLQWRCRSSEWQRSTLSSSGAMLQFVENFKEGITINQNFNVAQKAKKKT
jgi:hypothetical protein